jgi:type I restriction enzyme S subunit
VSELPKGWVRERLKNLVQPRSERVSPVDQPDALYIGLEHVQAHTNEIVATVPASTMASSSAKFEAGDILYGRMRPYLNKVVQPKFAGLASAEFIVFPEVEELNSAFLLKRLSAVDFVEFACSQYEGDRPRVKFDALGEFQIDLPPRTEQTRIVAKLEELLSDLDAGMAELKAAQKKLGQYRKSLLKAAVEGALTAEWRVQNPPNPPLTKGGNGDSHGGIYETGAQLLERILTERRARWEAKQLAKFAEQGKPPPKDWQKKYPETVRPDTTDLPALPEGWVWATTGLIAESIVPNRDKPLTFSGDIPWITTPDFEQTGLHLQKSISGLGLSDEECAIYRARVVPSQGVIMTCVGRFGLSAVLDTRAVINQQLHAFIPESGIRSEYLAYVIQAQRNWLERNATSTTIAYLNKEKCEALPVPLPPTDEQDAILTLLKSQLGSIAVQLRNVDFSLKQSTAQRQNILRAAFAGQLVPQDPTDEPASQLLERIRAERAAQTTNKKPRGRKAKESE